MKKKVLRMLYIFVETKIKIMAVEKTRVVDRFRIMNGTIGLSNTRLDEYSARLAPKIKDDATDEEIDAELNNLNEIIPFKDIKKSDDRLLNEVKNPNKKPQPEPTAQHQPKNDDDPLTQILGVVKSLQTELSAIKADKLSETIGERFRKDERISNLKGLPDSAFKGRAPKTEEEYESTVEEFVNDWKPFLEKNKLGEQGNDQPASGKGGGDTKEVKPLSSDQAKEIAKSMGSYS